MAGASSSAGPDRFGLDKTKGLNDLCRRDARIRAEKEAAAVEEFSRRFDECSLQDQMSLSAQRHFALQVELTCLCVWMYLMHLLHLTYLRKPNLAVANTCCAVVAG